MMKLSNNLKKHQKIGIIFTILYFISVFFFFFLSLQSGSTSSNQSSFVTEAIIKIILIFNKNWQYDYDIVHNIVRKLIGHFGYSSMMGILGFLSWYFLRLKMTESLLINLIIGLFIASVSEILQMIPNDRGPSFGDLLINYMGYLSGLLIIFIIIILFNKRGNYDN